MRIGWDDHRVRAALAEGVGGREILAGHALAQLIVAVIALVLAALSLRCERHVQGHGRRLAVIVGKYRLVCLRLARLDGEVIA